MDFLLFTSENEDNKIRMTTSMDVAFVLYGLFHEQQNYHANKLFFDRIWKYRQQTKTKLNCATVYVHSFTSKMQDNKMYGDRHALHLRGLKERNNSRMYKAAKCEWQMESAE